MGSVRAALGHPSAACTHAQAIRDFYQKEIQRDLVEDVKSETSGNYGELQSMQI